MTNPEIQGCLLRAVEALEEAGTVPPPENAACHIGITTQDKCCNCSRYIERAKVVTELQAFIDAVPEKLAMACDYYTEEKANAKHSKGRDAIKAAKLLQSAVTESETQEE
jgi:hypothetical protein